MCFDTLVFGTFQRDAVISTGSYVYLYTIMHMCLLSMRRWSRGYANGLHREKTCLPGLRQSDTQASLLSFREQLDS